MNPEQFRAEFDRLVKHFGSQTALGRFLGVKRSAVSHYRRKGYMPVEQAWKLQKAKLSKIEKLVKD